MSKLKIAAQLALPLDTVTSTLVIYGGKGMGKTNLGSVLMEELARAGLRFSVVDPMGVWWGLRHDKSGKGKGIEVLILGGVHGDIPIEPTAGAVVADLVVDESVNVVIDISRRADGTMWSIGERIRFVTDYAKRLYQRQGERRRPLMQVIDEAARFIPQMMRKNDDNVAHCMGAVAVLVEEGRNVGIGVTLITQRSARLNKDVAELADCMIAFRTVGPNSRRAVMDWLGEHVEKGRLKELDLAVRTVPIGSGLVVSPGWLEIEKIVEFRERETFDSSKTPKAGHVEARVSGEGAKPDLAKYQERMAATIEKAKAEDPKELRRQLAERERRIRELERSGGTKTVPAAAREKVVEKRVEIPVLKDGQIAKLGTVVERMGDVAERLVTVGGDLRGMAGAITEALHRVRNGRQHRLAIPHRVPIIPPARTVPRPVQTSAKKQPTSADAERLSGSQQRIINALAWGETIGLEAVDKTQLALLSDQRPTSGGYFNNLGALRSAGLITYPAAGTIQLTDAGRGQGELVDVPQTTEELHRALFRRLSASQVRILEVLIAQYPNDLGKDELAEASEQRATSGGYFNNLGRLRSLGLIDYPRPGRVVAEAVLFLEGVRP